MALSGACRTDFSARPHRDGGLVAFGGAFSPNEGGGGSHWALCLSDVHFLALLHHCGPVALFKADAAFPHSGWADGWGCTAFLVLPVLIALFSRLGSDTLLYRAMFLEEIGRDYVRTARAKGLSEGAVLRRHVLRNAALPIITSSVAVIPMLFMGSLIMESFFGIPGLGSYTIDALGAQDFSVVRTMVFLGTFAYIIGLIATDIVYAWVDPRIRLA